MKLYKFVRTTGAVLGMARGALKFTPIDELNDPSEMTPVMDRLEVRSSLDLLRANGMTPEQFEWLQRQGAILERLSPRTKALEAPQTLAAVNRMLRWPVYENLEYMEQSLFLTIRNIRSGVGVLSLSERYDSLPMWAHYANLGQGYVVVLDNLERTFRGDATGSLDMPKPVAYVEQLAGMTFDPSTQDRLFFSKYADWSYEREWRVVSALDGCRRTADGLLFLRDVDPLHMVGVICGWRSSAAEIDLLSNELEGANSGVQVILSRFEGGRVQLDSAL